MIKLDTSDSGKAASVAGRAAILFAKTCGMLSLNIYRDRRGETIAYDDASFESVIEECFPETQE
jgi:hypothetical protein